MGSLQDNDGITTPEFGASLGKPLFGMMQNVPNGWFTIVFGTIVWGPRIFGSNRLPLSESTIYCELYMVRMGYKWIYDIILYPFISSFAHRYYIYI